MDYLCLLAETTEACACGRNRGGADLWIGVHSAHVGGTDRDAYTGDSNGCIDDVTGVLAGAAGSG